MSADSSSISHASDHSVSVLLLRLQSMELLIPKAMVADVLSWNEDNYQMSDGQTEDWHLGEYEWHERTLSLVCFEKLIQTEQAQESMLKRKVIILKGVADENKGHHYALHCKGFPKPLILSESSLDNLSQSVDDEWVAYTMLIGDRLLNIPDFHKIENTIWMHNKAISQSA